MRPRCSIRRLHRPCYQGVIGLGIPGQEPGTSGETRGDPPPYCPLQAPPPCRPLQAISPQQKHSPSVQVFWGGQKGPLQRSPLLAFWLLCMQKKWLKNRLGVKAHQWRNVAPCRHWQTDKRLQPSTCLNLYFDFWCRPTLEKTENAIVVCSKTKGKHKPAKEKDLSITAPVTASNNNVCDGSTPVTCPFIRPHPQPFALDELANGSYLGFVHFRGDLENGGFAWYGAW